MNLDEIKSAISEVKKICTKSHTEYVEHAIAGEVKFVELTIKFKVDKEKKTLDYCKKKYID